MWVSASSATCTHLPNFNLAVLVSRHSKSPNNYGLLKAFLPQTCIAQILSVKEWVSRGRSPPGAVAVRGRVSATAVELPATAFFPGGRDSPTVP